jgi:hypothetical protein
VHCHTAHFVLVSLSRLLATVDAGGESLANQIQKEFKTVNISRDGEITFLEFQQAVASTDLFVQVRACATGEARLVSCQPHEHSK